MSGIETVDARDIDSALTVIRRDGVVHLKALFPEDTIQEAARLVDARHPEFADLESKQRRRSTGKGRFIAPVVVSRALHALGLFDSEPLKTLGNGMLGDEHVVEAFGMMMSGAGSLDQGLHADGVALFPETGLDVIVPPSSMAVFMPLVPVGSDNGATQFQLGSHRVPAVDENAPLHHVERFAPGDAMAWDFRTQHRGKANTTDMNRPALHFTLSRPFWFDHQNYDGGEPRLIADADVVERLDQRYVRAQVV